MNLALHLIFTVILCRRCIPAYDSAMRRTGRPDPTTCSQRPLGEPAPKPAHEIREDPKPQPPPKNNRSFHLCPPHCSSHHHRSLVPLQVTESMECRGARMGSWTGANQRAPHMRQTRSQWTGPTVPQSAPALGKPMAQVNPPALHKDRAPMTHFRQTQSRHHNLRVARWAYRAMLWHTQFPQVHVRALSPDFSETFEAYLLGRGARRLQNFSLSVRPCRPKLMLVRGIYRRPSLTLRGPHRRHMWNMCPVAVSYVRHGTPALIPSQILNMLASQVQCTRSGKLGVAECMALHPTVLPLPDTRRCHTCPKPGLYAQVTSNRRAAGAVFGPTQSTCGRTSGFLNARKEIRVVEWLPGCRNMMHATPDCISIYMYGVFADSMSDQKWHRYPRARVRPDGTRRRTRNELAARSARRNAPGNQRERADTAAPRAQEMNQQPWRQAADRESRQPHWQNARGADARPRHQHQDWYYDEEDEDDEDYQFDTSDRHEVHATEDDEGYLKIWWQGEWWFRQKPPDPPASPKKRQQASSSSEQRRPTTEGAVPPAPAQHVSEGLKQFVPPARDSVPPQSLRAVREKWNLLAIIEDDINVLRKKKVALMFKTFFEMGHFVKHHDDFHHSESLKIIPAAGNWNLAFVMCLISRDKLNYANHSTFGTAVECWLWSLSKDADFEPILTQFAGMLRSVIALFEGVPMSLHEQIHWFDSHQDLAIKFDYYFPAEQLKDDEQIVRVAIQDQTSQDSRDDDMTDRTSKHMGNTAPATRTAEPASSDAYVEMEVDYPTGQTPPNQSGSIPHSPRRVERYNIYTETTYASSDGTSLPTPARDSAPLGEPTKLYWKLDQSLSKRLSVVLRHDSEDFGLTFDEAGWTKVSDLLRTSIMKEKGATLNYIRSVVYWNDKQRFALEWRGADLYIRAVQGHSKKGLRDEAVMRPLGDAELPEYVLHATNWDFYGSILAKGVITGGLSQSRTHIHCVSVDRSEYRNYPAHCDIAIILSPKESGAVWFRSMNGYYLTRGADGKLAPHCIKAVRILASGEEVFGSEGPPAADIVMQAIVRSHSFRSPRGSRSSAPSDRDQDRTAAQRAYTGVVLHHRIRCTVSSTQCIRTNPSPLLQDYDQRDVPGPESQYARLRWGHILLLGVFLVGGNGYAGRLLSLQRDRLTKWLCTRRIRGCYRRRPYILSTHATCTTKILTTQMGEPARRTSPSRAGPKSSGWAPSFRSLFWMWILILCGSFVTANGGRADVRVTTGSSTVVGATQHRPQQSNRMGEDTGQAIRNHHNSIGWIAKRSLRRARARAYATGGTHYKGTWYTRETLTKTHRGHTPAGAE